MLDPMEAVYRITVRNSGDEVLLCDEDVKDLVEEHIENNYPGVLCSVEVERKDN